MKNKLATLMTCAAAMLVTAPCHAITIVLGEVPAGGMIPGTSTLAVNANATCLFPSSGNFRQVIQDAADYWETIYTLPYTITVTWGFANIAGSTHATSSIVHTQQSGAGAGTIDHGSITINASPNDCWYVDADTATAGEYPGAGNVNRSEVPYYKLPGRTVEVARFTNTSASGNTSHNDLFSVVLHELGHLLGLKSNSTRYKSEISNGLVDVVAPRPASGNGWSSMCDLFRSQPLTRAGPSWADLG